jgi:hypothetical protein
LKDLESKRATGGHGPLAALFDLTLYFIKLGIGDTQFFSSDKSLMK